MTGLVRYNSFTEINVIKNPEEFFGRMNELRTIFTRLQGLQSTSNYGERKIGKSSLLFHVFQMILSELRSNYKKVYLDTLRTPGYHSYIAYITASLHSLRELCIKSKLKLTFFQYFANYHLENRLILMPLIFYQQKEMVSFSKHKKLN